MITRSLTHWGIYDFHTRDGELIDVTPTPDDPDPSLLGRNLLRGNTALRVRQPAVRKSFLNHESNHQAGRGSDEFVDASWDVVLELIANELIRVSDSHGNQAIYGGSYGWASAGRFHHAQSQLHRFLNTVGGYTASANAYSFAAAEVILPHVIGHYEELLKAPSSWPTIISRCELMVCFGGMPLRNSQITNGGMGQHVQAGYMESARQAGIGFVNVSPMREDVGEFLNADWLAVRPGTDVALMLGIAYILVTNNWHDQIFLNTYCVGFDKFLPYLLGEGEEIPKTPAWASAITGLDEAQITTLARRMARSKTMISLSWSLSRHQHGEQPYWMGITLAAMLGQIGLPGTGIGLGYAVENKVGKNVAPKYLGHLPQGANPIRQFIPVARITEMLESPGSAFSYNGHALRYPEIKLIYWSGGNPFHHHQDLNRLKIAWQKPDTIICHELVWNALAQHSDIVLPVASFLERNDIGGAVNEDVLVAMKQVLPAFAGSRTDYDIFSGIAERLGQQDAFTEGRSEMDWVAHLYDSTRAASNELPAFEDFWDQGEHHFRPPPPHTLFAGFRSDPAGNSLQTPSGKIHLFSDTIAAIGLRGHASWYEPQEWLGSVNTGRHPFHLISHQPAGRLHSQLDQGEFSQAQKVKGLEPLSMNTDDALRRQLQDGDTVRVYNERGSLLAGLRTTPDLLPGVLHIATGAWWNPDSLGMCRNGNPNAVTLDIGTSDIAQGPSALTCLVNVEKYNPDP